MTLDQNSEDLYDKSSRNRVKKVKVTWLMIKPDPEEDPAVGSLEPILIKVQSSRQNRYEEVFILWNMTSRQVTL